MTASLSFQKPKRLIEEVEKDPLSVIKKVFAESEGFTSGLLFKQRKDIGNGSLPDLKRFVNKETIAM